MVNERLQQRENELDDLKKQLHTERTKQEPIDPFAAKLFLTGIRDASIQYETFDRLLVNSLIDRIYLYDDHFRLLLKNSNKKGTTKREAAEIERYFDNKSSTTALGAPPKEAQPVGITKVALFLCCNKVIFSETLIFRHILKNQGVCKWQVSISIPHLQSQKLSKVFFLQRVLKA